MNEARLRPARPGSYILLVASLSLVAFIVGLLVTMRLLQRVTSVQVPDLIHKTVEEARSSLRVRRLRMDIASFRFDQRIPINQILSQDPAAGAEIKSGRTISVIVSRGSQEVTIPDISGLSIRQATLLLQEKGLNLGRVTRTYDTQTPKDIVMNQFPVSGHLSSRGIGVNLLVSYGPRPIWFVMPNLKGWSLDNATRMLTHVGMSLKEIKRIIDDTQPTGTVINQTPKPGGRVEANDPAGLTATIRSMDQQQTSRLATIQYTVPSASMELRIKLVVRDDTGLHEIYNAMEKPNTTLTIRRVIQGAEAVLYIYVNGEFKEERSI